KNLKKIQQVRKYSGAKSVLALKCFSTWAVFDLMKEYMDGTTSSSLYEARLGHEKFGKEVHAYSVGYSPDDIRAVKRYASKVIFNSPSQLQRYYPLVRTKSIGLRVNPGISYSHFDLADPARRYSRLGTTTKAELSKLLPLIDGVMFHYNCENDDFNSFSNMLDRMASAYGEQLKQLKWVSIGGGIYFTKDGYPLDRFCKKLKDFSDAFGVQVYLEPGEAAITESGQLITTVLDIVNNERDIAIVDASTEAHMLDLLIYRTSAKIKDVDQHGKHLYMIAGRSCLAGDVFGTYRFTKPLKPGSKVTINDAAGYTMVKKNWFNGLQMPSIVIKRLNGRVDIVRQFSYNDFIGSLS
ncbi:MAG: carboxynorspermidine decarboxylase, partial [Gammaproteobacteria bacterium RIFOXYB2_FULL_38_6]